MAKLLRIDGMSKWDSSRVVIIMSVSRMSKLKRDKLPVLLTGKLRGDRGV